MMQDIYAKAQSVIIWLGKDQPKDLEAIQLLDTLYERCNGAKYDLCANVLRFGDFDCEAKGVPIPLLNPTWTAVFHILAHPWFSRVWVIQELLVAQRSVVWRGLLDINPDKLLWMAMQIGRHRDLYDAFNINIPTVRSFSARNIAMTYLQYKSRGPVSIWDTLTRNLGAQAKNPRDRYFVLAGVSCGLESEFVDYKRTFRDIACLVGKMSLLFGVHQSELGPNRWAPNPKVGIQLLVFDANPQNYKLGIPSWVPDLLSPASAGMVLTSIYNTLQLPWQEEIPEPETRWPGDVVKGRSIISQLGWSLLVHQVCSTFHKEINPPGGREARHDGCTAAMLTFL
jgi:hypothetical protein